MSKRLDECIDVSKDMVLALDTTRGDLLLQEEVRFQHGGSPGAHPCDLLHCEIALVD